MFIGTMEIPGETKHQLNMHYKRVHKKSNYTNVENAVLHQCKKGH